MKYRTIFFLLLSIPLLGITQTKWQAIDRLIGTWQVKDKPHFESWEKLSEYEIEGEGFRYDENKKKKVLETLQISGHPKGGIYFKATVPDQNEGKTIPFALMDWDRKNLIFENVKHDFPQKIHYSFRGKKRMIVHVSGSGQHFSLKMRKVSH